jgi:hypothetical protein
MGIVNSELTTGTLTTSRTPVDGAEAMFILIRNLMNAGWLHHASGTGTSGTFTTTPGSGGTPDANCLITTGTTLRGANSWCVLKHPSGSLLVLHRDTDTPYTSWRVCYVPTIAAATQSPNNGGSISATVAPRYATEQYLKGTSSTFVNALATDGTYRWHVVSETTDGTFWAMPWILGTASLNSVGGLLLDKVATGSYPTEDTDPYVWYTPHPGDNNFSIIDLSSESAGTTKSPKCYLRRELLGEGWVDMPVCSLVSGANNRVLPSLLGTNPHNAKDDGIPVIYARRGGLTTPVGWKGLSTMMRYNAATHATGEPLTKTTTRDRICIGDFNLYWDGTVPTI